MENFYMLNFVQPCEILELSKYDYIPIILGGLFALATIMLAVFSIISNMVTDRTCGVSLISLRRYRWYWLLAPIYSVFLISILMIKFNDITFLIISSIVIVGSISFQTRLILQPIYDFKKGKEKIVAVTIKEIQTLIKKEPSGDMKSFHFYMNKKEFIKRKRKKEEIITQNMTELLPYIAFNKENKYINHEDKKRIYAEYVYLAFKENVMDEAFTIKLIEYGVNIFGMEYFKYINEYGFSQVTELDFLVEKCKVSFSEQYYKRIFENIHDLFEAHESGSDIDLGYLSEKYQEFIMITFKNALAMSYIVDFIYNTDLWKRKDCLLIKSIIDSFSRMFSLFDSYLSGRLEPAKYEFLKKFIYAFKNKTPLSSDNEELNRRFEFIINL